MLAVLLQVSVAAACGGFAPQSGALTSSDAQKALFDIGEEEIAVTYTANYTGTAADFAWVIAVPGEIVAVEEGDAELLAQLDSLTAPQVELDPAIGTDEGCGCGASKSDKSGGDLGGRNGDTNEVIVTGSGYAGDYAYTTLSASDAGALITWLDDHGYQTDLLAPAITTYVEDPLGWAFVALQYAPSEPDATSAVALDPVRIRYGKAADGALHAQYPGLLGQSSSVSYVHNQTWVLASSRASLGGGWTAPENPDEKNGETWDVIGVDYKDPQELWRTLLLASGGTERGMWMTWSGAYGSRWLTRYDSYLTPATFTTDPVYGASGDNVEADTVIYLMDEAAWEERYDGEDAVLALGLVSLGLAFWRRRRAGGTAA